MRRPHAAAFRTCPLLLCHTPWAPTPRVLRRWLYQPRQQIRRRQRPRPWQVQRPRPAALPLIRACQHLGVRLLSQLCRPSQPCQQAREGDTGDTGAVTTADHDSSPSSRPFDEPSKARTLIRPTAQPTCGLVQRLRRCRRCRPRTPSLHRHRIAPPGATRLLASLSPLLALLPSRSPPSPLWSPTPRRHAATDAAHDAQPTTRYYDLPARMPALSLCSDHASLVITTHKQYTARAHGIGAIVGDHMRLRTRQRCPAQQRRKLRRGATDRGWK